MKKYLFFISQPYSFAILRPIQEEIRNRGDKVCWYFDGPGEEYLKNDEIKINTIEEVIIYNPRAVFVPGNRVFDFFPGVKVQVFHGFSINKRTKEKGHFRIRGFFDLYCTQGPDTTIPFQELSYKHKYFKVVETGWPKIDPYFSNEITINENATPTIIYTSTFTKNLSSAPHLYNSIRELSKNKNWNWIITFHPRMDKEIKEKYSSLQNKNVTFIETDNLLPYLQKADVMVSDTSSIISEFLILHKPVVTFRNNKPESHLINITNVEELKSSIDYALTYPNDLMQTIGHYTNLIHPYKDGKSSKRVIDATESFINNDLSKMPSKPLNLFRKLKMRKRVKYYKF